MTIGNAPSFDGNLIWDGGVGTLQVVVLEDPSRVEILMVRFTNSDGFFLDVPVAVTVEDDQEALARRIAEAVQNRFPASSLSQAAPGAYNVTGLPTSGIDNVAWFAVAYQRDLGIFADSSTPNYSLTKPEVFASYDTWGNKTNGNWDKVDTELKRVDDAADGAPKKAANETITGNWTFTKPLVVAVPTADTHAVTKKYVDDADTALDGRITTLDGQAVKLTGNQTVNGTKTFGTIPVLPASNPTSNNQAARKKYVDDQIAAIGPPSNGAIGAVADASPNTGVSVNGSVAGSALVYSKRRGDVGVDNNSQVVSNSGSSPGGGTWRCCGNSMSSDRREATVFVRIA